MLPYRDPWPAVSPSPVLVPKQWDRGEATEYRLDGSCPEQESTNGARRTTVSAVIPALNEAENLRWLLPRLRDVDELIVVDGNSEDGTADVVREICPEAVVIQQPPCGKGAALRVGFAAATSDVVVMLDADGSMDPSEIKSYVALIERGFDVVKGSRFCCGGGSYDITPVRAAGNRFLLGLANALFRTNWTELCYGYIALRRSSIGRLKLHADGFEIETQICARAAVAGLAIAELPSKEFERRAGDSHLRAFRDGLRILRTMLRARFLRRADESLHRLKPANVVPRV